MTNFFGSVMKTIHTDSAYKSLSNKKVGTDKTRISLERSISDNDRMIFRNSDAEDQFNNLTAEVILIYASSRLVLQFKLFHDL